MAQDLAAMLGIRYPIIQAPMAGTSNAALAAAVANAGGLGSIAVGASTVAQAREAIRATRTATAQPFNVNLFCHQPAQADPAREAAWLAHLQPYFQACGGHAPAQLQEIYRSFIADEAMLELLLAERPAVVSFHFGLPPARFIAALKAAGIVLLATATTLEEAQAIAAAGIDMIVAQGSEAGGHRGVFDPARDETLGSLALTRLLSRRLSLPIITAGGIMDGAGIAATFKLGASGVQLGTAFVSCPESSADAAYRAALLAPGVRTAITAAISGRPARGIVNRYLREIDAPGRPPVPDYPRAYDAGKALHAAAKAGGDHGFAAHWAGQGVALARALPAADLLRTLIDEWRATAA